MSFISTHLDGILHTTMYLTYALSALILTRTHILLRTYILFVWHVMYIFKALPTQIDHR